MNDPESSDHEADSFLVDENPEIIDVDGSEQSPDVATRGAHEVFEASPETNVKDTVPVDLTTDTGAETAKDASELPQEAQVDGLEREKKKDSQLLDEPKNDSVEDLTQTVKVNAEGPEGGAVEDPPLTIGGVLQKVATLQQALLQQQSQALPTLLHEQKRLQEEAGDSLNKVTAAPKFFGSRRRALGGVRPSGTGVVAALAELTDFESVILSCMDSKGRLSSPPVLTPFLQAMMYAENEEEWSFALTVLEESRTQTACLAAFVNRGGLRILKHWMSHLQEKRDTGSLLLIQSILRVAKYLPVTVGALYTSQAPVLLIKGLKEKDYLDDPTIKALAREVRKAWAAQTKSDAEWTKAGDRLASLLREKQAAAVRAQEAAEAAIKAQQVADAPSPRKQPPPQRRAPKVDSPKPIDTEALDSAPLDWVDASLMTSPSGKEGKKASSQKQQTASDKSSTPATAGPGRVPKPTTTKPATKKVDVPPAQQTAPTKEKFQKPPLKKQSSSGLSSTSSAGGSSKSLENTREKNPKNVEKTREKSAEKTREISRESSKGGKSKEVLGSGKPALPVMGSFREEKEAPREKIKWADEHGQELKRVRVFKNELPEGQEEGASSSQVAGHNEPHNWKERAKQERMSERATMQKLHHHGGHAHMDDQAESGHNHKKVPAHVPHVPLTYRRPPPFELPDADKPPAVESKEKEIQQERCKSMMETFYLDDAEIPDSPEEPDEIIDFHMLPHPPHINLIAEGDEITYVPVPAYENSNNNMPPYAGPPQEVWQQQQGGGMGGGGYVNQGQPPPHIQGQHPGVQQYGHDMHNNQMPVPQQQQGMPPGQGVPYYDQQQPGGGYGGIPQPGQPGYGQDQPPPHYAPEHMQQGDNNMQQGVVEYRPPHGGQQGPPPGGWTGEERQPIRRGSVEEVKKGTGIEPGRKSNTPCRNWDQQGWCKFQDRCSFTHIGAGGAGGGSSRPAQEPPAIVVYRPGSPPEQRERGGRGGGRGRGSRGGRGGRDSSRR